MKAIVTVEGDQYELEYSQANDDGYVHAVLIPISKPQKTLVQVAAEATEITEERYRNSYDASSAVFDEIERRLQALEAKGK